MKTWYLIWMVAAASTNQGGLSNGVSSGSPVFHNEAQCQAAAKTITGWTNGIWVKADCFPNDAPTPK